VIQWARYEDEYDLHEAVVEVFAEAAKLHRLGEISQMNVRMQRDPAEPWTIRKKVCFSSAVDSDKKLRAEMRAARKLDHPRKIRMEARARARAAAERGVEPPLRVRCPGCGAQSPTHRCPIGEESLISS